MGGGNELREQGKDFLAGTASGFCAKIIEYPFDTVKVRLQTSPGVYRNGWHCVQSMMSEGGFMSLWRGLPAPLVGSMAENSLIFWSFGLTSRILYPQESSGQAEFTPVQQGIAGFASGWAAALWLTPVEYIKCRLQTAHTAGRYTGAWDCFVQTVRERGPSKLMTGAGVTMLRDMPGAGAYFGAYATASKLLAPDAGPTPFWAVITSGSAAGCAYWLTIYPVDLVKSRIQTADTKLKFWPEFKSVYRKGGIGGLYNGIGVTLPRAVISNGVIFFVYEKCRPFLDDVL